MKKILILLSVMCVSLITKGQLNLLHSFQKSDSIWEAVYLDQFNAWEAVLEPVDCYILPFDIQLSQINIYNQNFVLIKQIDLNNFPVPSPLPSVYHTQYPGRMIRCLGKHLINTDDKIEFLVSASFGYVGHDDIFGGDVVYSVGRYLIINEDKEIVYVFDRSLSLDPKSNFSISKIGNQLVLITFESDYTEGGHSYWNIYSLGGNYNPGTMVTYTRMGDYPNPYPNPTQNTITLPYTLHPGETTQLKVFNINGQLMETFNIGGDFDKILLNVNDYPKGTYIYTYNGVSKKFVVQ
ncbi:MAG: T9SS type A sorting domain-containing protein [Bacteroidales bacterium]|nr:T9SS type A sorting domain-containing protein [Bacteroidales bacterium]